MTNNGCQGESRYESLVPRRDISTMFEIEMCKGYERIERVMSYMVVDGTM